MKRTFVLLCTLILGVSVVSAQDAAEIIRSSRNRISSTTVSTRSRMVITAANGSTTERVLDQYSKDGANGSRTVIEFQSPNSVAGTRFLTMENPNGPGDQWIYLPNLGKVRRVAASEGGGSFMGTDFSYDDIASTTRNTDLDTHTLVREETWEGKPCYVIESRPKDNSYQYSRMLQWVDKDSRISYRIELYDRRNTQVKLVEMGDVRDVQGRLTPHSTKVTTLSSGSSTTIFVERLRYDDNIPERVFTTAYLENGRRAL
jgi:outer membrane lipoprotein-sorting protein